jgi:hypothetical protein
MDGDVAAGGAHGPRGAGGGLLLRGRWGEHYDHRLHRQRRRSGHTIVSIAFWNIGSAREKS